jgi:hypothetical protein
MLGTEESEVNESVHCLRADEEGVGVASGSFGEGPPTPPFGVLRSVRVSCISMVNIVPSYLT